MVFEDVIGQEHVITTLQNAIESKRLAHAYIFSGPRGIGKTTAARILAKAINCENGGPAVSPCNRCQNCIEITGSRSLDVLEIDGASNRGIDEIRNLRDNIRYLPLRGGYKIYIIDEFHMITKDAFNALLKTLEEPPEKVVFIFATTEPHKILPTILSRCQRLDFRRIPIQKIIGRLKYICEQDKITIDPESLFTLAQRSDGGMRDALTLLDQILSFAGTVITIDHTRQALGLISHEMYFELTDIIQLSKPESVFPFVRKLQNTGYDINEFLNGFLEHIRNILVAKTCPGSDLLEVYEADRRRYETPASLFSELDLLRFMNLLTETIQQIKWSHKQGLLFELALLKMTHMPQSISVSEALQKIDSLSRQPFEKTVSDLKKKNNAAPLKTEQDESVQAVLFVRDEPVAKSVNPGSIHCVSQNWRAFVDRVSAEKISIGAILRESIPYHIDGSKLLVHFTNSGFMDIHRDIVHREREYLRSVMKDITGLELFINCCQSENELPDFSGNVNASSPLDTDLGKNSPAGQKSPPAGTRHEIISRVRELEKTGLLKNLTTVLQAELTGVND